MTTKTITLFVFYIDPLPSKPIPLKVRLTICTDYQRESVHTISYLYPFTWGEKVLLDKPKFVLNLPYILRSERPKSLFRQKVRFGEVNLFFKSFILYHIPLLVESLYRDSANDSKIFGNSTVWHSSGPVCLSAFRWSVWNFLRLPVTRYRGLTVGFRLSPYGISLNIHT